MKPNFDIIYANEVQKWHSVLSQTDRYDCYHLPEYHQLAELEGHGKACLFVYQEAKRLIAWPFLLRNITSREGLEELGQGYIDATSVYGYPGPVSNTITRTDKDFIDQFGWDLQTTFRDFKLVSVFSRLHPLISSSDLVANVGCKVVAGQTVIIDLTLPTDEQLASYRKGHRYDIRKATRAGMYAYHDTQWQFFEQFVTLYRDTMIRLGANERYLFSRTYFERLKQALGDRLHLFVAILDDVICAASMFIHTDSIVQYHLSGSHHAYSHLAPAKLLVDEARKWGVDIGARILHLGGGVGSKADSLFQFKAGFSSQFHPFSVWHKIIYPDFYDQLTEARINWLAQQGHIMRGSDHFPSYRVNE